MQVIYSDLLCDLSDKIFCKNGHPHSSEEFVKKCENYHFPPLVRGMLDPEAFLRSQDNMQKAVVKSRKYFTGS